MQRNRKAVVLGAVLACGLAAAACGKAPGGAGGAASSSNSANVPKAKTDFTACMVTDTGGINDRSFNASAWAGMQAAQKAGKANVRYVQSNAENDYVPNINGLEKSDCKLIVTVGGLMAQATTNASKTDSKQHFAIVDSNGNGKNVQGLQFNTAQAGFLGGYLAAGYTKTGKVATFGGSKIPPVTIYMDGFAEGVHYYNSVKHKHVQVLGWNEASQNGSFTGSFTDQTKGRQIADNFLQQGADVIYPVAGGSGLGGAASVAASKGKAVAIWVDTDGCKSAKQYCSSFLTTTYKNVDNAVEHSIDSAAGGTFATKDYIGTLANGGVGLSPFHDFANKVPQQLQKELKALKAQIIAGKIKITSPSQPKSS